MATIPRPNRANEFLSKLFQARDTAHIIHLKLKGTGSYAAHKALNEFYDEVLDITDGLVESIQGIYGLQEISIPQSSYEDPITFVQNFYNMIESSRGLYKESWILNEMDDLSKLAAQTLYKLKFLQ